MVVLTYFFHVSLIICLLSPSKQTNEMDPPNTQDWADPDDIFSYNTDTTPQKVVRGNDKGELCKTEKYELQLCEKRSIVCEEKLKEVVGKKGQNEDKIDEEEHPPDTVHNLPCPSTIETDDSSKHYLKRFVNVILQAAKLNPQTNDNSDEINIKLSISEEKLTFLNEFGKMTSLSKASLRRLDEILSDIFKPKSSFFPSIDYEPFLWWLESSFSTLQPSSELTCYFLSVVIPAVWFSLLYLSSRRFLKSCIGTLPILLVSTYLLTLRKMIQEAELKQHIEMREFKDIPTDCTPGENWFREDKCKKKLAAQNMPSYSEITPTLVLVEMFGSVSTSGLRHIGSALTQFFNELSRAGFVAQFWTVPLGTLVLIVIIAVILVSMIGGNIRLPYFLGGVNFQPHDHVRGNITDSRQLTNPETSRTTEGTNAPIVFNIHCSNQDVPNILSSFKQGQQPAIRGVPKDKLEHNPSRSSTQLQALPQHKVQQLEARLSSERIDPDQHPSAIMSSESFIEKAGGDGRHHTPAKISNHNIFHFTGKDSKGSFQMGQGDSPPQKKYKKVELKTRHNERTRHNSF